MKSLLVKMVDLTCSSHVLAGPDWLEADKRDLHRQYEPHYVKSAVGWGKTKQKKKQEGTPDKTFNIENKLQHKKKPLQHTSFVPTKRKNQPQ